MNAQAAPTERQLRYLRSLASRTATTFAMPATRREASREIDRLRRLGPAPFDEYQGDSFAYATPVHEDDLAGFGAARTWRSRPPGAGQSRAAQPAPRLLARYQLSSGERLLQATRTGEALTVSDVPAGARGTAYTVETLACEEERRELPALLADYLARARDLDAVPMSREALEMLAGGSRDA